METLQDDVQVNIDYNQIDLHLEKLLGPTWKNVLSYETKPIGVGSVGSVLKGKYKYTTKVNSKINIFHKMFNRLTNRDDPTYIKTTVDDIAIKTIHPSSKELIQIDMELLNMFANYLDTYPDFKMLAFGETLRKFSNIIKSQLDLRNEGANLVKFNNNFAKHSNIKFPRYIKSDSDILLESLVNGIPLKTIIREKKYTSVYEPISDAILDGVIKQMFSDNFIHGDLHPGNIIVNLSNKSNPVIYMLDCGIVHEFENKKTHQKIANICFLLMKHNGYKAGLLLVDDDSKLKLANLMEQYNKFNRNVHIIVAMSLKKRIWKLR